MLILTLVLNLSFAKEEHNQIAEKQDVYLNIFSNPVNDAEEYGQILKYTEFVIENDISEEHLEYLNKLFEKGNSIIMLKNIYEFWLTTNEDISIIGEICNLKNEFWGKNWIENAFNKITNDKCGVITNEEQLHDYLDKGISLEEIETANILCRKGVKTIFEILDMRVKGETWEDIISIVDNNLPEKDTALYKKVSSADVSMNINDKNILNEISELSSIEKLNLNKLLKKGITIDEIAENKEGNLSEALAQYNEKMYLQRIETAKEYLKDMGLDFSQEEINKARKEEIKNIEIAIKNGFSEDVIQCFYERGYNSCEVVDLSEKFADGKYKLSELIKDN